MPKVFKYVLPIIIAVAITTVFSCRKKNDTPDFAQITFQKMYSIPGGFFNFSTYTKPTKDEGYIVAAGIQKFGTSVDEDIYLIRTNNAGKLLWSKIYGGTRVERLHSVRETADGGFIACGYTLSFGATSMDVYVIRTDGAGNLLWSKTFDCTAQEFPRTIIQTNDGGFLIVSDAQTNPQSSLLKMILIRIDANGNELWTKMFSDVEAGYSIVQTTDGGFIIGAAKNLGTPNDYNQVLIKIDSLGNALWAKSYGDGYGTSVRKTNDGGYIILGSGSGAGVIKTDENGNLLWAKKYESSPDEAIVDGVQASHGGFILLFSVPVNSSGAGTDKAVRIDSVGNVLWAKTFGTGVYGPNSIEKTSDGGYIISASGLHLIKTDTNGNSGCNENNRSVTVSSTAIQVTNLVITGTTISITSSNSPTVVRNGEVNESTLCFK